MASTYTGLGVQLMATGEKAGTWGTLTNTNWNIIEQISGGYTTQAVTDGADTDLSVNDGTTGATLAHRVIELTGSLSASRNVTIPLDVQTFYIVKNSCDDSVVFKYVSGSGNSVTFGAGDVKIIYATANDATNPDIDDVGMGTVTLTGTQTLTNKTLTSPKIGTSILDTNGNELALLTATGSAVNEITLANAATGNGPIISSTGETNVDLNLNPKGSGVLKSGTAAVKIAGKETMWVPATAMYATTTNGAEAAQAELTATQPELKTLAFDTTTAEYAQFNVCFPKSWDEGVVQFQTYWSASATDTGTGGFKLQGVSIASDVDYDTAYGTAVANTALAASGTQDDLMVNVVSGDVTIASAAVDTNTSFQIVRDVAVDTNTGDLRLVGVKIFYTTNAANDG